MTTDQALAFAIIVGMMALFLWDYFRYDVVAMLALLAAVAVGIVPPDRAFSGFSDQIVIIVGTALIVSAAISRSGVIDVAMRRVAPLMKTVPLQILILASIVCLLSALMKNIAALAIFLPIAFQIARRTGASPSFYLMPLSFAALLGGLMTLIGTSPNIIVSRVREELLGQPFAMFDFTPVAAGIAAVGILFLTFGYRLLPVRKGQSSADMLFEVKNYAAEVRVPPDSKMVGKTVADLEALSEDDLTVSAIIRERYRRYIPTGDWTILADDVLLVECEPTQLKSVTDAAGLELVGTEKLEEDKDGADEIGVTEAVITQSSPMIGRSPTELRLRQRYVVNLLAVSRGAERVRVRLHRLRFRAGDVVVLQGHVEALPETLQELGCLPLAGRNLQLGQKTHAFLPLLILGAAMVAVAFQLVPVEVAFFGAAALILALNLLNLKDAYEAVDWPILIMLGALIPVSEAVRTTGGTELIAGWLSALAEGLPPPATLVLIMVSAMAVTPFLNNAATVLVMAPIAASFAGQMGLNPDPYLMAVAIGAGCDFLTPIGHQCNTLVLGPGGYKFRDYARLGAPLSLIVVVVGVPLIMLVWPLNPAG